MTNQPSDPRAETTSPDLFAPTLQTHEAAVERPKPWRLGSQLWVAFFGGALAYTAIAYLNGQRLGLPKARLQQILAIGAVGFIATIIVDYMLLNQMSSDSLSDESRGARFAGRIVAVAVYGIVYQMQKSADRVYRYAHNDSYASLWKPGLIAVFGLGIVQNLLVFAIVRVLMGG
jgi:hypothetical protein